MTLQSILQQETPLMPPGGTQFTLWNTISIAGKNICRFLDQSPPPVYLLESGVLEERARQFQEAFKRVLPEVSFLLCR